jgi:carbamoyl-phosphate synthase small subunit
VALAAGQQVTPELKAQAVQAAKAAPAMTGLDLAQKVTVSSSYAWTESEWKLGSGFGQQTAPRFHVVAYDFGVKKNILRMLAERGCKVTVVPAKTPAAEVLKHKPDGIFLSNGPGDPEPCDYAIACAKAAMAKRIPLFGICLGHQMLALALGAKTVKMVQGHHGANHPVKDLTTGKVEIVSMNHGFTVDRDSLPEAVSETHVSLFDGTNCGIALNGRPVFSVQHHPEASPGPTDSLYLFQRFADSMAVRP